MGNKSSSRNKMSDAPVINATIEEKQEAITEVVKEAAPAPEAIPAKEVSEEAPSSVEEVKENAEPALKKTPGRKKKSTDTPPRSGSRASKRLSNRLEGKTLSPLI